MINRMSELAVKGATDTITDDDRTLIQQEIAQLKKEIQRVADTTEFNGQTLLDGSFDLKGYTDNLNVKVATYSDETPAGKYPLPSGISLVWNGSQLDAAATITANDPPAVTFPAPYPANTKVSAVDGTLLTITGDGDFSITLDVEGLNGAGNIPAINMDITGIGAMDMQIGANEDQIIGIRIPALSLKLMSIDDADTGTQAGSAKLIEDAKTALTYVNDLRSRLGAYQNRLEHTVETLGVTSEALTSAYSGLVDADMAEEAVEYSTAQILTEASTSVLAQANDRPSSALQLLQ